MRRRRHSIHAGLFESLEPRRLLSTLIGPASATTSSSAAMSVAMETAAAAAAVTVTVTANVNTPLDTIAFGNAASETSHGFASTNSQIIAGALSQPARQLLPQNPVQVNGGDITFTLAVNPVRRNYFTIKLWGSDDTDASKGRLYLYIPMSGVDYQVGYRHEGDYTALSVTADKRPLPGRFFYSTTLLPLSMTQGKTSLTLKIVSTGELYGLGSGGPPSGNYQFNMTMPSRGIYRAYTHTNALLDVTGETQGAAPATTTRPSPSESSVLGPTGTFTTGLNNWINGTLAQDVTTFIATDVEMLARSYSVPQLTAGYQKPAIVNKVIAAIDAFAADFYANPATAPSTNNFGGNGGNEVWGGRFGAFGWAIHLLATPLATSLDAVVDYGSAGGMKARRQAWGDMLVASRDFGRFNRDGRAITNQGIIADSKIYQANRGLLALGDARAFTETDAQRYLKEAAGLLPWLGSDLPEGGSSLKFGSDYYQVTSAGLTREWGYAGGYSEMAPDVAMFYKWTGNTAFREQAVKMVKAIAHFRRPAIDVSGSSNYRSMERVGLLAWRGVREADGYYANDIAYAGSSGFAAGMRVAGVTLDPSAVGYAKQALLDGQFFTYLTADARFYSNLTFDSRHVMDVYDEYNAVKAAADSGIRLPMTAGQLDYAWADEENGVLVIKRGNDRLWLEPYWQVKDGTGVNGIARFYVSTPAYEQYGVLETNPRFNASGAYFVRPNWVDITSNVGFVPPDNPSQAYTGEKLPVLAAPPDAREGDPFRGKVNFYAFRYGNYLIGMNRSATEGYELRTPDGFTSATDLMSGTTKSGTVTVAPGDTIALYLDSNVDPAPVPTASLHLAASGAPTQVTLEWSAASGATGYNAKRATSPGSPYATIASNVTGTSFLDTDVTRGATYYYVVSASNENGESYDASPVSASAGLPAPWANQDIGAVAIAGNSNLTGGVYTIRGTGGDIGSSADSFQFAYLPVSGNVTIVARLLSMTDTRGADKTGLMIRESLDAGARRAFLQLTPPGSPTLNTRSSVNGGSTGVGLTGMRDHRWLKLERVGSAFTAYVSIDGATWQLVGTRTFTMNSAAYVGLAVSGRNSVELSTSTFDSVKLTTTNSAPTVATPASASPNPANALTANLSIAGTDTGGEANLIYTWSTLDIPPAPVEFSVNGINAAKNTVATFTQSGTYHFRVTINDLGGAGLSATSDVTVNVNAVPAAFTGTAAADQWVVRRSGSDLQIWVGDGSGTPTHTVAYADVTSLTFIGDGGNDMLTIDSSDGEAVPAGGVMFDGGDADDLLVVKNSTVASFASVTFLGGDGEQTLTADGGAFTLGDDISAAAGDVTLNLTNAAIVTLGATQRLAAVTITGGARLDVRDHRLILTNSATGVAIGGVYDGVHGLVQAGYMYGDWGGSGIVTTMPDAADDRGLTTLAVATAAHILFIAEHETALWGGQAVSGSDTIVMYTYAGDLNFDGVIDAADYGMIDNWVQFPGTDGYANGDFNFDGVIDAADYGIIDNSVQLQGPPLT